MDLTRTEFTSLFAGTMTRTKYKSLGMYTMLQTISLVILAVWVVLLVITYLGLTVLCLDVWYHEGWKQLTGLGQSILLSYPVCSISIWMAAIVSKLGGTG